MGFFPTEHPAHWLPRSGSPTSVCEWLAQWLIRSLAIWPVYTAFIVTLILIIELFHPFGLGATK